MRQTIGMAKEYNILPTAVSRQCSRHTLGTTERSNLMVCSRTTYFYDPVHKTSMIDDCDPLGVLTLSSTNRESARFRTSRHSALSRSLPLKRTLIPKSKPLVQSASRHNDPEWCSFMLTSLSDPRGFSRYQAQVGTSHKSQVGHPASTLGLGC